MLQLKNPTVIIMMLNYNGLRSLGSKLFNSLDSILRIRYYPLKVVFVDNGSSDGSPDVIKERYGDVVEVISLGKNLGYALGNDIGVLKSIKYKPKYIIFMNNDFIVTNEDCINDLINYMERDIRTVCASGMFVHANRRKVDNAGLFVNALAIWWQSVRCQGISVDECINLGPSFVSYIQGAFACYRLDALRLRKFMFNPYFFLQWEETEACLNAWTYGLRTLVLPVEVGIHLGSATTGPRSQLTRYLYHRNKLYVLKSLPRYIAQINTLSLIRDEAIGSLYHLALRGEEGKVRLRAIYDGLTKKVYHEEPGPYEPLVIAPRGFKDAVVKFFRDPFKYVLYEHKTTDLSLMSITEDMLKSSSNPFIIRV